MRKKAYYLSTLILLVLVFQTACQKQKVNVTPSIQSDMRSAYQEMLKLQTYVWNQDKFDADANDNEISTILTKLSDNFHSVKMHNNYREADPGFEVTLKVHREQLKDISLKFQSGDKEYARWRLKGLTNNCIACHTRYDVSFDFVGSKPFPNTKEFSQQKTNVEFLIATRQFEEAISEIKKALHNSQGENSLELLKRWLLIKVRVQSNPISTAGELVEISKDGPGLSQEERMVVAYWTNDLRNLSGKLPPTSDEKIAIASSLLEKEPLDDLIHFYEKNFVKTLFASTLLHEVLYQPLRISQRRHATLLLAKAYHRLTLDEFDVFADLYLEKCIRQFPGTSEAKEAYNIYKQTIEDSNTGSGGLHLDEMTRQKIEELKALTLKRAKRQ